MSHSPATNIGAITKRIRTLGRLPFKVRGTDSEIPEESYLCEICQKLNLSVDSFLVKPGDNEHALAKKLRYLGRLSAIRRRRYCPFCRLVLEIVDRPSDQRVPSHVGDDDPVVYARWVVDGQEDLGFDTNNPTQHIYRPLTRRLLVYSDTQSFKDGYIALLSESAPTKPFFGRRLKSHDLVDSEVVKSWIRTCETEHGPECEGSLVHKELMRERKNLLRMIDVDEMCITIVPQDTRFVALSYLWGKNFEQLFTTSENLARLSVPGALTKEILPLTIKDTIKLTRMLGEKYLWTDSLALVHDKGFQYHDDWIYARAHLTVVAGSGKDANAGLPGVRKGSRTWHQSIEEIKPGLKLMVCHLAEDYISTSQWDSRAWTFQERMLSRRCLLFVNGRVYLQCRRTTFCEDMEMPQSNGWSLDSIDMPTRIFKEKPFVQYTSAVELYTRRELTNPADILSAFEGVEQVLEKRLLTTIYYGLFESMMDSSLIWESSKRLVKRPDFPSWSWSGWLGEIQWKFTEEAKSWIEWHHTEEGFENHHFPQQETSRIEPPLPWQEHRKRVARKLTDTAPPLLHFDTITAHFTLIKPSHIHKTMISPLRKRLTGPSALSTVRPAPADPGLIRAGIADCDGQWCGSIDLDETWMVMAGKALEFLIMSRVNEFATDELALWEGSLPDDVEDILARRDYGVYNVMLVSQYKGIYQREGLGRILTRSLEKAIGGASWKDVLLG